MRLPYKMPVPKDKKLYARVKRMADGRFDAPTSIYKSSWIVQKYKSLGGLYTTKVKPTNTGLARWFKEKWVDLKRPVPSGRQSKAAYMPCGRPSAKKTKLAYPLCRPSVRVTKKTPKTYKEISKKSLVKAKKQKKGEARIKFSA